MEAAEELYKRILMSPEIDHQFFAHFYPEEVEEIKDVRSLARHAGKQLGWKIRTAQSDPDQRPDGTTVVGVVVIESTTEDEQRLRDRADLIIRNMKCGEYEA